MCDGFWNNTKRNNQFMKKLFSLLMLAGFAVSVSAQTVALPGSAQTIIGGGTNKAAALTTNAFYEINCENAEKISLGINFSYLNAPGAGDVNRLDMRVFRGIGNGFWDSNAWQTISFAAGSSTAAAATVTNLTVDGIHSLRVQFVNVSTNSHATNLTLVARPKWSRVLAR